MASAMRRVESQLSYNSVSLEYRGSAIEDKDWSDPVEQ